MNPAAIWAIFKRDFKSFYGSLLGYLFVAVFLLLTFAAAFRPFGKGEFFNANAANLAMLNEWYPLLLVLFVPAITMSAWARERQLGTDSFLFTLPAHDWELVLAKFSGRLAIYSVALACTFVSYLITLEIFGDPDLGLLLCNYLGYFLLGALAIAVSMSASALTNNLTVAWILGAVFFAGLAFPDLIGWLGSSPMTELVSQLGVVTRFEAFGDGVVTLPNLLFFLCGTLAALYANAFLLGRRHWTGRRSMMAHGLARLSAITVSVVSIVLLTSSLSARLDVTSERMLALTPEALAVLENVDENQPVYVQAWISKEVPESYLPTREGLVNMLREFDARAGKRIYVAIHETEPFSEEAQRAETSFGITPRKVQDRSQGRLTTQDIFLGLALTCGSRELTIPFFDKGLPIQYELTRAIGAVSLQEKRDVKVMASGVDVFGGFDFQTMQRSESWQVLEDLKAQYDVKKTDGTAPIGTDVLVAPLPSSLEQKKIDFLAEHLRGGGRALLLCDPYPTFDPNLAPTRPSNPPRNPFQQQRQAPKPPKGDIEGLLAAMGLTWRKDRIVWDAYNPHPEWGQIPRELVFVAPSREGGPSGFNESDPVTSGLQELVLIYPGELSWNPSDMGFEVTPLLWTGTKASGYHTWGEMMQDGFFGPQEVPESQRPYDVYYDVVVEAFEPNAGDTGYEARLKTAIEACPGRDTLSKDTDLKKLPLRAAVGLTGEKAKKSKEAIEEVTGGKVTVTLQATRRVLAVRVKGRMRGKPDGKGGYGPSSSNPFEAIVVTDMDLVSNIFYNLRARGDSNLNLDNVTFVANCIDSLAGEDSYIALRKLRPKHRTLTRFEEVIKTHDEAFREATQAASKDADEKLKAAKKRLDEEVEKIEKLTNVDHRTRAIMIESKRQAESMRLEREEERINAKKASVIRRATIEREQSIARERLAFLVWALLFCLAPIVVLGIVVMIVQLAAERAGIDPARRRS